MSLRLLAARPLAALGASAPVRREARAFSFDATNSFDGESFALDRARERAAGFVPVDALDFPDLEVTRFFDKK